MAADNDSPGLKIAVAAFLSLSVILSVSLYFLYSTYVAAQSRLDSALSENQRLIKARGLLQAEYDQLKKQVATVSESGKK